MSNACIRWARLAGLAAVTAVLAACYTPGSLGRMPTEAELYRSRPERWVAFCRKKLNCSVRVLEGYGLREFTLLIRRKPQTTAPRQAGSRKAARRSPR